MVHPRVLEWHKLNGGGGGYGIHGDEMHLDDEMDSDEAKAFYNYLY